MHSHFRADRNLFRKSDDVAFMALPKFREGWEVLAP
jgi:hypothetical protein